MDLIVIEGMNPPSTDGYSSWLITLLKPTAYSNVFNPAGPGQYNSCREYFTKYTRDFLVENRLSYFGRFYYSICGGNLTSITQSGYEKKAATTRNAFVNCVRRGLIITNTFEKAYGWPLTFVKPARVASDSRGMAPTFIVSASRRWMRSPYLFSLHTLLMRLGRSLSLSKDVTTESITKEILGKASSMGGDLNQAYHTISYWEIIFANYYKLFGSRKIRYNWSLERLSKSALESSGALRAEGLFKLLNDSNPANLQLSTEIKNLRKGVK